MPADCADDKLRLQGMALFKAKRYKEAAQVLEKALKGGDGSPDCYTYLAGSHLRAGNYLLAVQRYMELRKAFKGLPAGDHAAQVLKKIDPKGLWAAKVMEVETTPEPVPAVKEPTKTASKKEAETKAEPTADDRRKAELEKRRQRVMAEAEKECARVRRETERQIQHAKSNSNQWYRYPDGTRKVDISNEHEGAIRNAGQAKINRIMENAERKCRSYR